MLHSVPYARWQLSSEQLYPYAVAMTTCYDSTYNNKRYECSKILAYKEFVNYVPLWFYVLLWFWFRCGVCSYLSMCIAIHFLHLCCIQDHMIQLHIPTHIVWCHTGLDETREVCFVLLFILIL